MMFLTRRAVSQGLRNSIYRYSWRDAASHTTRLWLSASAATLKLRGSLTPSGRKTMKRNDYSLMIEQGLLKQLLSSKLGLRNFGDKRDHNWIFRFIDMYRAVLKAGLGLEFGALTPQRLLDDLSDQSSEDTKADVLLLQDKHVFSEFCYLMGHFLWNVNLSEIDPQQLMLAKYFLQVSVEVGGQRAHLDLWILSQLMGADAPPLRTVRAIREAAVNGLDWRAMQLYISRLIHESPCDQRSGEIALDLTLKLHDLVEPGADFNPIDTRDEAHSLAKSGRVGDYREPWELLQAAAKARLIDLKSSPEYDQAKKALRTALQAGTEEYNHVDAMKEYVNEAYIPLYSEEWVKLKTQAATALDADSCEDLARYWLEKSGWYPCTDKHKPHDIENGSFGISWLILSASLALHSADRMGERYLSAALLLRQNGSPDEGKEWLSYGIEVMEKTCQDRSNTKVRVLKLRKFEKAWHAETYNWSETLKKLFGDPRLPKR